MSTAARRSLAPRGVLLHPQAMSATLSLPEHPFTLGDLPALGLSRKRLRAAVESGEVRRPLHGVYVASVVEDTMELRAAAAALVIRPGSVVRDRTAAWIHGVDVLSWAETEVWPPIETCVAQLCSPSRRAGVDGRTRDLLERDVMEVGGLLVTTPLRTALDLGCHLKRRTALGAIDGLMHEHGLTVADLMQEVPRFRGRRGVRQLRDLLLVADPKRESMRESWVALDIYDAGMPLPSSQHWIEIRGVPTWRLDFAYERHRIALEYDGEEWHARTKEQRDHDKKRRTWLRKNGWTVIIVTKDSMTPGQPAPWLDELAEALRERSTTMRRWITPRG